MRSRLGMLLALRGWFHAGGWFLGSPEDLVKRQPLSAISDSNPSLFPFIHRHATTGRSPVPALPFFGNNASQLLLAFKFVGSWLFRRGLEFVLGHSAGQNTRILAQELFNCLHSPTTLGVPKVVPKGTGLKGLKEAVITAGVLTDNS